MEKIKRGSVDLYRVTKLQHPLLVRFTLGVLGTLHVTL